MALNMDRNNIISDVAGVTRFGLSAAGTNGID
jgi:hypothetical protein